MREYLSSPPHGMVISNTQYPLPWYGLDGDSTATRPRPELARSRRPANRRNTFQI